MWRRVWSLLVVSLGALALVLALPPAASADAPLPEACDTLDDSTPLPGRTGPQADLIFVARALAEDGKLDAAERLFELARTSRPVDPAAGTGLAYVEARRQAARDAVEAAQEFAKTTPADESAAEAEAAGIRACYRNAIELDPDNEAAAAALAGGPADGTAATRAVDRWDAFSKGWIAPAVDLILPALAVLAILLVLARMITSRVVPVDAEEWPARKLAWWTGLALLVASAAFGCALATSPSWGASDNGWRAAALMVIAALAVCAWWTLHVSGRQVPRPSLASAGVAGMAVLLAAFLAMLAVATLSSHARAWLWVLTVAVACIGILLVAAGRGRALRLLIQVKRGDKADPIGTAYVLGRLHELGSSPPQGLKTPQQVDVADLPISALSSLPGGRFAEPLTRLVGLVTASVPWRAIVEDGQEGGLLVVTLTRNGVVAQTAVIDAAGFLPEPSEDETAETEAAAGGKPTEGETVASGVDRGDLLTAAAAVIITELAERHARLKVGLCGARSWESVAAHVVATKPPASAGGEELRRELLAFAVQKDPRNALAQLAYLNELGRGNTGIPELRSYAQRLDTLRATILRQEEYEGVRNEHERKEQGYLPLQLRLAHTLTATRLNIAVSSGGPGHLADVLDAAADYTRLCSILARAERTFTDSGRRWFLDELVLVAAELKCAVTSLFGKQGLASELVLDPVPQTATQRATRRATANAAAELRETAASKMALGLQAAADRLRPAAGIVAAAAAEVDS